MCVESEPDRAGDRIQVVVCPPRHKQLEDVQLSLLAHCSAAHSNQASSFFFVVSSSWWKKWIDFTRNNGPMPEPIDNSSISKVSPNGGAPMVQDGLSVEYATTVVTASAAGADCIALPPVTWKAVSSWFGTGLPVIHKGSFIKGSSKDGVMTIELNRLVSYTAEEVDDASSGAGGGTASPSTPSPCTSLSTNSSAAANACFTCGTPAVNRCARCAAIFYCSASCQRIHWYVRHAFRHLKHVV